MGTFTVWPTDSEEATPPTSDEVLVGESTRWECLQEGDDEYIEWVGGTAFVNYTVSFPDILEDIPPQSCVLYGRLTWRQSGSAGTAAYNNTEFRCWPKADLIGSGVSKATLSAVSSVQAFSRNGAFHTGMAAIQDLEALWSYNDGVDDLDLEWDDMDLSTMEVVQNIVNQGDTPVTLRISELSLTYTYDEPPELSNVQASGLSEDGEVFHNRPTIQWEYSDPEGAPQTRRRVIIVNTAAVDGDSTPAGEPGYNPITGDGFNPLESTVTLYDSGWHDDNLEWDRVVGTILNDGTGYYAYVAVASESSSGRTIYSLWTVSSLFTVNLAKTIFVLTFEGYNSVSYKSFEWLRDYLSLTDGRFNVQGALILPADPVNGVYPDPEDYEDYELIILMGVGWDPNLDTVAAGLATFNTDTGTLLHLVKNDPYRWDGRNVVQAQTVPMAGEISGNVAMYSGPPLDIHVSDYRGTTDFNADSQHYVVAKIGPWYAIHCFFGGEKLANSAFATGRRMFSGIATPQIRSLSQTGAQLLANALYWTASKPETQVRTLENEPGAGVNTYITGQDAAEGWGTGL